MSNKVPVPNRYGHIDFSPPQDVREEYRQGVAMYEEGLGGENLERATVEMARRLAAGEHVSPAWARKAYRWHARNERFGDNPDDPEMWTAWKLWAGFSGQRWYRKLWRQMEAADENEEKKMGTKAQEHRFFPAAVKQIDEARGVVEAVVAVMGNIDLGHDVIHPGAFTKTLAENGNKIRVLDNHNAASVMDVIGKAVEVREIDADALPAMLRQMYPEATGGLYTKTQYMMDDERSRAVFNRVKEGLIDEYSIGYDPIKVDYETVEDEDGKEKQVRHLRELRLWEYSPVIFAMNPATATVAAKGLAQRTMTELEKQFAGVDLDGRRFNIKVILVPDHKGAVSAQDFPIAGRDRAWDGDGAAARCRVYSGGPDVDDMDWDQYRRCFVWYDETAPELFGSYKLGIVDIIDNEPHIIPRGVFAAAAAVEGARGGVDIPESDMPGVRETLGEYYSRMAELFEDESIIAPWNKSEKEPAFEQDQKGDDDMEMIRVRVAAAMESLHAALYDAGLMGGKPTTDEADESEVMLSSDGGALERAIENTADNGNGVEPTDSALTPKRKPVEGPLARERLADIEQLEEELREYLQK